MGQVLGFLPLTWETWMEFLVLGFELGLVPAVVTIWEVKQAEGRSVSLPLFVILPFKKEKVLLVMTPKV